MEAVADLRFLEVAQEIVDLLERLGLVRRQADILGDPRIAREVEDAAAQAREAAPVHAACRVVLVQQRLEVFERTIGLGARQRRHEVVDDDGAGAALGLRTLAGIVDDERIEMRQLAPQQCRIGRAVERRSLARQPLERAVLAIVDHRMRPESMAQP